jgi:predicted GIY-YIG superfamily endonuclease
VAARVSGAVVGCYLLHFQRPIYGAQHYLGWSVDIGRRVRLHLRGRGARLVRQALKAGIDVQLVRVWPTVARKHEYVLKRRTPKRYCPRCHHIAALENDVVVAELLNGAGQRQNVTRRSTMAE